MNRATVTIRGRWPDEDVDQYEEWVHEYGLERDELGVWLEWSDERTFVPWASVVRVDFEPCQCSKCIERLAA